MRILFAALFAVTYLFLGCSTPRVLMRNCKAVGHSDQGELYECEQVKPDKDGNRR